MIALSLMLASLLGGLHPPPKLSIPKGEVPGEVSPDPKPKTIPPQEKLPPMKTMKTRFLATLAVALLTLPVDAADPPQLGIPPGEHIEKVLTAAEMPGETRDWALADLNVPLAWKKTEGKGVVIAVLDTGVMATHRDLKD